MKERVQYEKENPVEENGLRSPFLDSPRQVESSVCSGESIPAVGRSSGRSAVQLLAKESEKRAITSVECLQRQQGYKVNGKRGADEQLLSLQRSYRENPTGRPETYNRQGKRNGIGEGKQDNKRERERSEREEPPGRPREKSLQMTTEDDRCKVCHRGQERGKNPVMTEMKNKEEKGKAARKEMRRMEGNKVCKMREEIASPNTKEITADRGTGKRARGENKERVLQRAATIEQDGSVEYPFIQDRNFEVSGDVWVNNERVVYVMGIPSFFVNIGKGMRRNQPESSLKVENIPRVTHTEPILIGKLYGLQQGPYNWARTNLWIQYLNAQRGAQDNFQERRKFSIISERRPCGTAGHNCNENLGLPIYYAEDRVRYCVEGAAQSRDVARKYKWRALAWLRETHAEEGEDFVPADPDYVDGELVFNLIGRRKQKRPKPETVKQWYKRMFREKGEGKKEKKNAGLDVRSKKIAKGKKGGEKPGQPMVSHEDEPPDFWYTLARAFLMYRQMRAKYMK